MHRNALQTLLTNYKPASSLEQIQKMQMLEFLQTCPDCFLRSCQIGHFTASSWLVNAQHSKCLLLHHAKLDQWLQLGGHCDGDSDVLAVAIKEASEESGLTNIIALSNEIFDIDIHIIPPFKDTAAHYHFDVRFLLQAPDAPIIKNNESKDLRWFDLNHKLLPTQQKSVVKMLTKYLNITQELQSIF